MSAKIISEARKAAARANGAKSRGPITSAGKVISSKNALQHGMTAVASAVALAKAELPPTIGLTLQAAVLPNENPLAAAEILAELTAAHNPVGAAEHRAVELVAAHHWLSLRLLSVQQGYFLNAATRASEKIATDFATAGERSRAAETFRQIATEDHSFKLLIRYSSETRRAATAKLRELQDLQTQRLRAKHEPENEPEPEALNEPKEPKPAPAVNEGDRYPGTPRTALCPCKSGEKYKRCCGRQAPPILSETA